MGNRHYSIIERLVSYLEDENRPLYFSLLTLLSAIIIRNVLELSINTPPTPSPHMTGAPFPADHTGLGQPPLLPPVTETVNTKHTSLLHNPEIASKVLTHFSLFYIYVFLGITLIISLLSNEKVLRVARLVGAGFIIIVTVPIVDLILSALTGTQPYYAYLFPDRTPHLLTGYLSFLSDTQGITFGMRLEVFIVTLSAACYTYIKTASLLRSLIAAVAVYSFIFISGALPYTVYWLSAALGLDLNHPELFTLGTFNKMHLLLILLFLSALCWMQWPTYMKALVNDLRFTRTLHYAFMIVLGIVIAYPAKERFTLLGDFLDLIFIFIALLFAGYFSIITNNLADKEIDRISNPDRPTITGTIPEHIYQSLGPVCLIAAWCYSAAVDAVSFLMISCFLGGYFLYSMPPLRLKRIPILSKAIIAFNCLAMLGLGIHFAGGDILSFPKNQALFLFLALTACINFIDIKDIDGDRIERIKTIPVLLGLKKSKILIGFFFLISYALFPYFMNYPDIFLPSFLFGLAIFVAINLKNYKEHRVFIIYLSSFVALLFYI